MASATTTLPPSARSYRHNLHTSIPDQLTNYDYAVGTAPISFSDTLDYDYDYPSSISGVSSFSSRSGSNANATANLHTSRQSSARLTTPLAPPPPPPRHLVDRQGRYGQHTLGPTFSEEEDGDDSEFIAGKMAMLGLDPRGDGYGSQGSSTSSDLERLAQLKQLAAIQEHTRQQQAQLQHHQQQQQQSLLLQQILSRQPTRKSQYSQSSQTSQEELALLHLQQLRAQAQAQAPAVTDPQLQAHFLAQAQAQAQRALLATQLQLQQQQQQQQLDPVFQQQQYLQQLHLQQQQVRLAALQQQQRQQLKQQQQQHHQQQHQHQQQQLQHQQQQQQHALERNILAAQVQAKLRNRQNAMAAADDDVRARFESAPTEFSPSSKQSLNLRSLPLPTPADFGWREPQSIVSSDQRSQRSVSSAGTTCEIQPQEHQTPHQTPPVKSPIGRFAQARQAMAAGGSVAGLSGTIGRRAASEDDDRSSLSETSVFEARNYTAQTSPSSSISEHAEKPMATTTTTAREALGLGRPAQVVSGGRAWSVPSQTKSPPRETSTSAARAASYTVGVGAHIKPVRQPNGPPGPPNELGDRNFQSRIRRQAGLNLGMLNRRRTESPSDVAA